MSIFTYTKPYTHAFWSAFYTPPELFTYDKKLSKQQSLDGDFVTQDSPFSYSLRQFPISFSSGAIAGILTSFIASPFELTKLGSQIELVIRRGVFETQANNSSTKSLAAASSKPIPTNATATAVVSPSAVTNLKPLGTFQIVRQLVRASGWTSLYSGYRYMIIRDIFGAGVYFAAYDSIRSAVSLMVFKTPEPHPFSVAIAGALSGAICWITIYPLDTVKSRYQRDVMTYVLSKSILLDSNKSISGTGNAPKLPEYPKHPKIELSGWFNRSMYRGLAISLFRTSILGMCMFSAYEKLMEVTA